MGGGGDCVIGNGGCTFFMYTLHLSLLHASFFHKLCCLNFDNFLDRREVWHLRYANHPLHVSVIHICKFHLCGELHF